MPIHKAEAIVLNRRDFRETSVIVNFFTLDYGKISGILKGIRTQPAKFASNVEPFSLNDIIFYKKHNTNLHLVSACELKAHFGCIRGDMVKIGMASVMMELLDALMQLDEPNIEIFNLACAALSELEITHTPEKILTIFKIKLLSLSGFKPHLDSCVSCSGKILDQSKFSLSLGGLLCPRCSHKDSAARQIFRGTTASILHIERNDIKNNLNLGLNPLVKKELSLVLSAFLNYHLGKELKSQKTIDKIDNFQPVSV